MKNRDDILWETARHRASFRKNLFSYLVVSAFLWAIWLMTDTHHWHPLPGGHFFTHMPWPAWVMFWWGIGLAFKFSRAYLYSSSDAVEEEYRKLRNRER